MSIKLQLDAKRNFLYQVHLRLIGYDHSITRVHSPATQTREVSRNRETSPGETFPINATNYTE